MVAGLGLLPRESALPEAASQRTREREDLKLV